MEHGGREGGGEVKRRSGAAIDAGKVSPLRHFYGATLPLNSRARFPDLPPPRTGGKCVVGLVEKLVRVAEGSTGSRLGQNLSISDFSLDSGFGHRM